MKVADVMTANPVVFGADASLVEAATAMRDRNIGDVLVERDGALCGIVTDRDIVVRGLAEGNDPGELTLGDIATTDLETVSANDEVEEVVSKMEGSAVRRIPVVDGGRAIGILSIGDLAEYRDRDSALGQISSAPPNN
ncbi:MAG TPA: CBS domain-containing protein [Ilumatobacteraceae bacterium]|nr:CBS domain-containing protein [Ilumatobacteraceae bacterium]